MSQKLAGKVAVITGASKGIGLAVARRLAAEGNTPIGLARTAPANFPGEFVPVDLADRARNKKLKVDEVQGGTFTITNPGVFGGLFGTPIINQPQVGILGVGTIEKRPVVRDDAIAIRPIMNMVLGLDHRANDGAGGAAFLRDIKDWLESVGPETSVY